MLQISLVQKNLNLNSLGGKLKEIDFSYWQVNCG